MNPPKDSAKSRKLFWKVIVLLALIYAGSSVMWYRFPKFFELPADKTKPKGTAYAETIVKITDEMASRWLPNDLICPSILLDDPQNFQLGELEAARYATRILRDNLSRLRTTDRIDQNADDAFTDFSNDPLQWIMPSAESKYLAGKQSLEKYRNGLVSGESHFYPRADNLREFLTQFISLLGGASQRLANAPRGRMTRITVETAGDTTMKGEKAIEHLTPWTKIDENFYHSQGILYVLRQLMIAIKTDFSDILEQRKGVELVDAIIEDLNQSQFNPLLVLNGNRGGIFANHSLNLQAQLEDCRQKMRSLQSITEF